MADIMSKEERSALMSHIRSVNTKPEVALRRALWRRGFRYHVNFKGLPGTPDIVLPKYRTVVFVHGCFWHGHKGCKDFVVPKTNTEFWINKLARNQERDHEVWRLLEAKNWFVIIVWGCEFTKAKFADTVERVANELVENGEQFNQRQKERRESLIRRRNERKATEEHQRVLMDEVRRIGAKRKQI